MLVNTEVNTKIFYTQYLQHEMIFSISIKHMQFRMTQQLRIRLKIQIFSVVMVTDYAELFV